MHLGPEGSGPMFPASHSGLAPFPIGPGGYRKPKKRQSFLCKEQAIWTKSMNIKALVVDEKVCPMFHAMFMAVSRTFRPQ